MKVPFELQQKQHSPHSPACSRCTASSLQRQRPQRRRTHRAALQTARPRLDLLRAEGRCDSCDWRCREHSRLNISVQAQCLLVGSGGLWCQCLPCLTDTSFNTRTHLAAARQTRGCCIRPPPGHCRWPPSWCSGWRAAAIGPSLPGQLAGSELATILPGL